MKYRLFQRKSRVELQTDDRLQWAFTWKEYMPTVSEYSYEERIHRVPFFLSLHAHLRIEEFLGDISERFLLPFVCKPLLLPYHIVHSLVCGYGMKEILLFWKSQS
jgi:hypothetical protein